MKKKKKKHRHTRAARCSGVISTITVLPLESNKGSELDRLAGDGASTVCQIKRELYILHHTSIVTPAAYVEEAAPQQQVRRQGAAAVLRC